jgi:hypothetical protein
MTIGTELSKEQQTDSAEVYTFSYGSVTRHYTSYFEDIIIGASTFLSKPIKRTEFEIGFNLAPLKCTISMPLDPVFSDYDLMRPCLPISVEIRKYYLSDLSSSALIISGSVSRVSVNEGVAFVEVVGTTDILTRLLPRVAYQHGCNNNLFDSVCALSQADYLLTADVSSISADGKTIYLTSKVQVGGSAFLSLIRYIYGKCQFGTGNDWRLITFGTDTPAALIQLHYPYSGLLVGSSLKLYPGCNKSGAHCVTLYGNIEHFVGFPYRPAKDVTTFPLTSLYDIGSYQ